MLWGGINHDLLNLCPDTTVWFHGALNTVSVVNPAFTVMSVLTWFSGVVAFKSALCGINTCNDFHGKPCYLYWDYGHFVLTQKKDQPHLVFYYPQGANRYEKTAGWRSTEGCGWISWVEEVCQFCFWAQPLSWFTGFKKPIHQYLTWHFALTC